jgi:oligoribonuclease NrnB/cAMP/cGMP phosphodiesterase (DHH superfamily)
VFSHLCFAYFLEKLLGVNPLGLDMMEGIDIPSFDRIIADSDLDGLCAAAVLKSYNPDAEVIFSHAALVRSGKIDHLITPSTAMVDLPFHPNCGWYLDHHQTNRPTIDEEKDFLKSGGTCNWEAAPSAARVAYDLLSKSIDLSHLDEIMPIVDALDSGGITLEEFLTDGPVLQLSRTLSLREEEYMQSVLELFASKKSIFEILSNPLVSKHINKVASEREVIEDYISKNTEIIDRLAICRLENSGFHSNGYLVTAWAGDRADACCIIHGYDDGSLQNPSRPPLSASFYANSFLENGQNRYDLSRMATALDPSGGGHVNACGCRIQTPGIESNLSHWLEMWHNRKTVLSLSKD